MAQVLLEPGLSSALSQWRRCCGNPFPQNERDRSPESVGNEAPATEVWAQAELDFKQAQTLLPESWPEAMLGRATNGAATGFLGKLYLYNERYAEAEVEFAKMDGQYDLLSAAQWDDNFGETNENNIESVFEIQFHDFAGTGVWYGDPEVGGTVGRQNAHAQLYSWTDWSNWAFQPRRVLDFQYNDESSNTLCGSPGPANILWWSNR